MRYGFEPAIFASAPLDKRDALTFDVSVLTAFTKIYVYSRPHEDGVFKFIHFGERFRIYACTVSVFIVFVWTEGLNA